MGRKIERRMVDIMTTEGGETVAGEIYGLWAVTKHHGLYTVTHTKTGLRAGPWVFTHPNIPRRCAKLLAKHHATFLDGRAFGDKSAVPVDDEEEGAAIGLLVSIELGSSPSAQRN